MRAVLFDFDGTILDTETPEFDAWEAIYAEHGIPLPHDRWLATIGLAAGTAPWHPMEHLAERVGPLDREHVRKRQHDAFRRGVEAQPLRPGVARLIHEARAAGVRVGLASSATRDWIDWNLARLGLAAHFETIRTREDVVHAKPDPALYRLACDDLAVAPGDAVAIEDSHHGIAAARAAGVFTVATPNGLTRHLDLSAAHWNVDSLEHVGLEALRAAWRRHRFPAP